ncbi:MAG: MFS transporter [Oscillospiraceae bacterium]|nr:MFS transporter [Oscillospiraceae bacterium]
MKKNRVWLVFLGCMLYYGSLMGLQYNCAGVLISGIMSAEGYTSSSLSGFFTMRNTIQALGMLVTARLLKEKSIKAVSLGIGLCSGASLFLMSLYNASWMWLISGILAGLANSLSMLLTTTVINAWFTKKKGTFLSLATVISGVLGMVLNPIVSRYIESSGWRSAAVILGLASFGMNLAGTLLLVKRPEDVDAEPYGGFAIPVDKTVDEKKRSSSWLPTWHELKIYLFVLLSVSMTGKGIQMTSYIPQYSTALGYPLEIGGKLTSCIMIGNFTAKILFGLVSDWIGAWKSVQVFLALLGLSFFLLATFGGVLPVMFAACVLLGFAYMSGLGLSMVAVEIFDKEHFEEQYSRNSMFATIMTIPLPFIISYLFDLTGSFRLIFYAFAFLMYLGIFLISLRYKLGIVKRSET